MRAPTDNPAPSLQLPKGVLVDQNQLYLIAGYNKWWVSKRGDVITQSEHRSHGKRIRRTFRLHRVLTSAPVGLVVDHKNGNKLDNRMVNLRVCLSAENGRNLKLKTTNKSGVAGVHWDKARSKWVASIKFMYRNIALGRFESLGEAVHTRRLAEAKWFGEFAPTRSRLPVANKEVKVA